MNDNLAYTEEYIALLNSPQTIVDNLVADLLSRDCYSIRKCFNIARLGRLEFNAQQFMSIKKKVCIEGTVKHPEYTQIIADTVVVQSDAQLAALWATYIERSVSLYWEFPDWYAIEQEANPH
jgi:hypothetical protein